MKESNEANRTRTDLEYEGIFIAFPTLKSMVVE